MQCIYALIQSKDDSLAKQEKFLKVSIENTYSLYLLWLSLFVELHQRATDQIDLASKKYLDSEETGFPDEKKFTKNKLLLQLSQSQSLKEELANRKLDNWYLNEEYVKLIYKEIIANDIYKLYMKADNASYESDKQVIIDLFKEVTIYPNPANDFVNIKSNVSEKVESIEFYNVLGQLIYSENIFNVSHIKVNVSNFRKGVYFIKVNFENAKVITSKLILN